jgi:hypothetical protein
VGAGAGAGAGAGTGAGAGAGAEAGGEREGDDAVPAAPPPPAFGRGRFEPAVAKPPRALEPLEAPVLVDRPGFAWAT